MLKFSKTLMREIIQFPFNVFVMKQVTPRAVSKRIIIKTWSSSKSEQASSVIKK